MRKGIGTAAIIAAGIGLVLNVAAVAAPDEYAPESRAYLSFDFGGAQKNAAGTLRYGLRLDHDRFFVPAERPLPALMQLDFSRHGLRAMQVNGLNVLRPAYRARQNEEPDEEAPADAADEEVAEAEEDEGFFETIGNWFGGLFGEDEEEAAEVAEADTGGDAGGDAAADDDGDGAFLHYDAVDWGLLAVGLAGVGYIAAEVADGEDDANPTAAPAPPPGGCPPGQRPNPIPGGTPACLPAWMGSSGALAGETRDPDHQTWLDSGTGQMGDLQARD